MIERTTLPYRNLSKKFTETTADFTKQYCSIYTVRLKQMEELLLQRIKNKWGDKYPVFKLHKLSEEEHEMCVVIGTLFKDQKLKPSVLKQLAEGVQLLAQPMEEPLLQLTDETDLLFIEDEVQRYQILGKLDASEVVTGITCAILGKDIGKGKFMTEDYIFAGCRPQIERPLLKKDTYVLFLSGLDFVNEQKIVFNLELLADWLNGIIEDNTADIARVVIAGNSIRTVPEPSKPTISMTSRTAESDETIEAVKSLDYFLYKLCEVVDVDIMPGENDPSNHILPQKPMHYCMFPNSASYKSLNTVPNPYFCSLNDTKLFGTSGQPIRDIMRYSDIEDPLQALEYCLKWNHLAPTAPDTLGCYPFYDKDVFILDDCPHVFFAGNQKSFGSKIVKGEDGQQICLLSIPEFSTSLEAVMLNLKNLDCKKVKFQCL